jgi:TolB-like protein
MRCICLFLITLLIFSCSSTAKFDNKPNSALVAFESVLKKRKPVRVAVTVFTAANGTTQPDDRFGPYITDEIAASLTGKDEDIRIFERKRLDAIAEEHALTLTDMMSGEAAQQIGNLAPIDYIVTGTYTVLNSSVKLNGRVLMLSWW